MKKLIVIMAIVIITGVSNAASGSIEVDSFVYAGEDYTTGLISPFEVGTYEFFVESGAWSASYGLADWMWNVRIYQPSTETVRYLGSDENYSSADAALTGNLSTPSVEFTIGGSGENLVFSIYDADGVANNRESVIIGVNYLSTPPPVVPEPISYILFVAGGALMAGKRYLRRKG